MAPGYPGKKRTEVRFDMHRDFPVGAASRTGFHYKHARRGFGQGCPREMLRTFRIDHADIDILVTVPFMLVSIFYDVLFGFC